jgi:argininosuccinate lyase
VEVEAALLALAGEHVETVMPGYTALQHGQPWTFGHYAVGWSYAFGRDLERIEQAFAHTNLSSLGASALAGTSWPLDRARVAELLGFDGLMTNSRDAGFGTRDYVAEILAAAGIAMTNLNALCSDLYLWSSWEFSLIELGDGFSGTSSFMPQKKNAWAFDWVRGAAGNVIAASVSSLAAMRGSSSTDGSLQDYPEQPLAAALETATDCFTLIAGALGSIRLRTDVMAERARSNWATASNLAETIARTAELSFREAHGIVGSVVRTAVDAGVAPGELTGAAVDRAATDLIGRTLGLSDSQVRDALDPVRFIETRATTGSVNPAEVRTMIAERQRALEQEQAWLSGRVQRDETARKHLALEVDRLLADNAA